MKPAMIAPAGTLAKKPPHGAPCNRCGLCCQVTLCPLGRAVLGREHGPCPALSYDDQGSVCGLIVHPERFASIKLLVEHGSKKLGDAAAILNGAGTGCDARVNGETPNEAFYQTLVDWDRAHRGAIRLAKQTWGVR